ncbi:MAG: hypothetical protein HGA98_05260 [Deltaproteobacteria bacterium]|nr:hypothetical protein [Deltaproteobacteria bacterium]
MKAIVEKIRAATGSLASSSEELSATARALDDGSRTQSEQVERSAVAMTEMSQTNGEVARNAEETSDAAKSMEKIALQGRDIAHGSGAVLGRFVEAVNDSSSQIELLGKRSEEVHGIVDLIREIADQTNLLALNAAIEAARAGEQGRGFAVVADNVRQLAEKSITAANDVAGVIDKMQKEIRASVSSMKSQKGFVGEVSGQVEETLRAIDSIVTYVGNVTERVDRIAVAVGQQSSASREVSANMEHVSVVTRGLLLSSSEMKDTAGSLSEIAFALNDTMKWFKV